MRSATQPYCNTCNTVEYGFVSLRMRFFSQNFGTIKRILPGSSSPSHREGPGIEVAIYVEYMLNYIVRAGDCHMIKTLVGIEAVSATNLWRTDLTLLNPPA